MKLKDYEKADDLVNEIRLIGYEINIWKEFILCPADLYYTDPLKHQGEFCPLGVSTDNEEFLEIRRFAMFVLNRKKVALMDELEKL